uniref:Uncharacterized protein n=1 Tax=Prolemur simus TaxID=1328070 RepID=A0A8C9AGW6_PROSS
MSTLYPGAGSVPPTAGAASVQWHPRREAQLTFQALTYFVELPGVGVSMLNVFLKSHHGDHKRPEFLTYLLLHIRSKPSPYGDGNHTLFHSLHVNLIEAEGYYSERN